MTNVDSILKSRDITVNKGSSYQSYGFSSGHVWMWELDLKTTESWRINAFELWCWETTLESPLDSKKIQPANPKRNQSWIFIGKTDTEVESPILLPLLAKNWLIWRDPDAGKDWMWEEKGRQRRRWMASLAQWTWVSVISGSWWWTGSGDRQDGMLQSIGSERVRHDWVTELTSPPRLFTSIDPLLSYRVFWCSRILCKCNHKMCTLKKSIDFWSSFRFIEKFGQKI